jgi:hypothetical protein
MNGSGWASACSWNERALLRTAIGYAPNEPGRYKKPYPYR